MKETGRSKCFKCILNENCLLELHKINITILDCTKYLCLVVVMLELC